MGKFKRWEKGGACSMGKLKKKIPRNVHTERIGAGPCMACDHASEEKKSYGEKTWEIWEKLGIGGEKIWEIWEKLGNLWGKKSEYGKNWVRFLLILFVYFLCVLKQQHYYKYDKLV